MKILLVKPDPLGKQIAAMKNCASLTLQIIAGLTPKEHHIDTVDESYETINFDVRYDLIAITCMTYDAPRGYQIADEFRKRGIAVVIGGWHASAMPEEAKQHVDCVVIGEAELIWPRLLKDFEDGNLKPFYKQEKPIDPKLIPAARRDVTHDNSKYTGIEASRGCSVGCDFCAISNKPGGNIFRPRPIENIIEEIKNIEQKFLFFFSPSMTMNPEYSKNLFNEMIGLNKKFSCYGNVNVLGRDDELLRIAKKAGCVGWTIGFESVSQETINNMGKKSNKVTEYENTLRKIYRNGMVIRGAFIFGFDGDTIDVFDSTLNFIYKVKLNTIALGVLTPFPGTPLFNRLEKEKRILTYDWSKYTTKEVVFQPKNMTPEELLTNSIRIVKKFYGFKNTLRITLRSNRLKLRNVLE